MNKETRKIIKHKALKLTNIDNPKDWCIMIKKYVVGKEMLYEIVHENIPEKAKYDTPHFVTLHNIHSVGIDKWESDENQLRTGRTLYPKWIISIPTKAEVVLSLIQKGLNTT